MNDELIYTEENKSSIFGKVEDFLHNIFKKSDNEPKANLSTVEWLIYIGTLLFTLAMPFLYSRLTTENFLTPKEFFTRITVGLLGGLFCARLFAVAFSGKKVALSKTSFDLPLVAFFGFCALSVIWNYNGISAIRDLRCVFVIMLLFPIIVNVFRSRWQVELLLWVIVFTGLATALIGFMETYNLYFKFDSLFPFIHYVKEDVLAKKIDPNGYYLPLFPQLASPDYAMGSVVSTFGNRNYLGTFAMFVAFIPLAFFFYYKKVYMKVISLGLFGWLLYGLYITRCRAALIGLAIGFLFMLIMTLINDKGFRLIKRYGIFFGIIVVFFIGGLIVSAITIKSETMWGKIKLTFTLDRLISNTYERMWVWYGNNQAFVETPFTLFFGQGFGSFKHFFPLREGQVFSEKNKESFTAVTFRQAHNDWLQIFSELGIIGMFLFLFLVKRFFSSIQNSLRRDIFSSEEGRMNGDHVLIIALGAGMVAQLFAALPDFPFHRIETAVFAVLFLSLVPVLTETNFFKSPLKRLELHGMRIQFCVFLFIVSILGSVSNLLHEINCWDADIKVREAEMLMTYRNKDLLGMLRARKLLLDSINQDPLPGDPYNKLAAWYEQCTIPEFITQINDIIVYLKSNRLNPQYLEALKVVFDNNSNIILQELNKLKNELNDSARIALAYCDKAWKNINFNARSTYHSIIFRRMHIYYHMKNDLPKAYLEALKGLSLTAGEARAIYYLYAGKIAADLVRIPDVEKFGIKLSELKQNGEKYLTKLLKYDQFRLQAQASLALFYSYTYNWQKALENANEAHRLVPNDPSMVYISGVAALNLGNNYEAINYLSEAIRLSPTNPTYHRDIGIAYKNVNRLDDAKNHFEKCAATVGCPEEIRAQALKELDMIKSKEENGY